MKKPMDNKRSSRWPALRRKFLKGKVCAVCGGKKKLEAHHVIPFHLDPVRELDETNLIALCEGNRDINCHLMVGHLGSFKSCNVKVFLDSHTWNEKIRNRP